LAGARDTLFIPSGKTPHLFFVLNNPCKDNKHLLVNVSRVQSMPNHDPTCILNVGDHPFITEPSVVLYGFAYTVDAASLAANIQSGTYPAAAQITAAVHKRICDGVIASPRTQLRFKHYWRDVNGLVQVVIKRSIKKPG
jgi:hypothetical protein